MMRNIVLLVSSGLVLAVLFGGYLLVVRDPDSGARERESVLGVIPAADAHAQEGAFEFGPAKIPAGQHFGFTVFDDETGLPVSRVQAEDWQPVQGSQNEFRVTRPEITLRLPSGMVATVSADLGEITLDRQQTRLKPRLGRMLGHATIAVDTETNPDRTPIEERPADLITIHMDDIDFDLELGTLRTAGPVRVQSVDFEIAGTGLDLEWNQADNRVESLLIHRGERMVLYTAAGLFGGLATAEPADDASLQNPATNQTKPPAATPLYQKTRKKRDATAYLCTLVGDVSAEQWRGDARIGRLDAEELRLLFDLGGGAGRMLGARRTPTSAPASGPASAPIDETRERLVVSWSGPLSLQPAPSPASRDGERRRIEARGRVVTLTSPNGSVRCGRLEYYDDTQQIWLHRLENGRVEFTRGDNLYASAASVYIDRRTNTVKLVGDVTLESTAERADGTTARKLVIRCSHWAELDIDPARGAAPNAAIDFGGLSSALFVGDVSVELADQMLTAHRLTVGFKPSQGDDPLESLLESAVAIGDVVMSARDRTIECGQLELAFVTTEAGDLYPAEMDAVGAAVIRQGDARIVGSRIHAEFEPLACEAPDRSTEIVLRSLDVTGQAELFDPASKVVARGDRINAQFTGRNQPSRATVHGTSKNPARLRGGAFIVYGDEIVLEEVDVERNTLTLHVTGRSRVRFKSKRGLQGQIRREALVVDVTSTESLEIDGQRNTVHFVGEVVARSGEDRLRADTLTLLLGEVPAPPEKSLAKRSTAEQLLVGLNTPLSAAWQVFELLDASRSTARQWFGIFAGSADRRGPPGMSRVKRNPTRRELLRLSASNAVIESESLEPGSDRPLTHSSLAAPTLEVDFRERLIRTQGETTLLLTNRKTLSPGEVERAAPGMPSALISRGASQTAMKCEKSMTYALGEDGPNRRDKVLFEGAVFFVHVAGKQMVNLADMLPADQLDAASIERLPSRRTMLECERLECEFGVLDAARGGRAAGLGGAMQLAWLIASQNVYLRDQRGSAIREVFADWVEFDRERGLVHIKGNETADARVYYQDTEKGILFAPAVGPDIQIDLISNTIRSRQLKGDTMRP